MYFYGCQHTSVSFTFSQITQNEFSVCKAAERGDAVASLSEVNAADGNSGKLFWRNVNETLH